MFNYPTKIPHTEYSFSKQTSPQLAWSLLKFKKKTKNTRKENVGTVSITLIKVDI